MNEQERIDEFNEATETFSQICLRWGVNANGDVVTDAWACGFEVAE